MVFNNKTLPAYLLETYHSLPFFLGKIERSQDYDPQYICLVQVEVYYLPPLPILSENRKEGEIMIDHDHYLPCFLFSEKIERRTDNAPIMTIICPASYLL